jgi:hypothetical protein
MYTGRISLVQLWRSENGTLVGLLQVSNEVLYYLLMVTEHCFELLRVNTMCSANLAPSTFYWRDTDPPQLGTHQHDVNQRKCVKWDVLDEWGSKRRVDVTDQHVLRPS